VSRSIGKEKELVAKAYLQSLNYRILEENYTTKFGEIDLIGIDEDTLVFIEVKYRSNSDFGEGHDYLNPTKRLKLKRTAWHYIQKHACHLPDNYRLDLVSILGDCIDHYKHIDF